MSDPREWTAEDRDEALAGTRYQDQDIAERIIEIVVEEAEQGNWESTLPSWDA